MYLFEILGLSIKYKTFLFEQTSKLLWKLKNDLFFNIISSTNMIYSRFFKFCFNLHKSFTSFHFYNKLFIKISLQRLWQIQQKQNSTNKLSINFKLPHNVTSIHSKTATPDAFLEDWNKLRNIYMVLPSSLINRIIYKLR